MDLDRGAVQGHRLNLDADDLSMLQTFKDPIQNARLRPAAHAGINGVPTAKALGQAAPLATLFSHVQDGIQDLKIGERVTLPRWRGRQSSIRRYWASVISMPTAYHSSSLV